MSLSSRIAPASIPEVGRLSVTSVPPRVAVGLLIALGGAVYLNALDNPFVYDDHVIIGDRPPFASMSWRALLWEQASRPVVTLSYMLDAAVWGDRPFAFHVGNVLLHMANIALLYHLVCALVGGWLQRVHERGNSSGTRVDVIALTAAALFAVHPLMSHAVGYISARAEVLCATFVLASLLWGVRTLVSGGWLGGIATLVFWGLGLATKETALVVPLLLLAFDRWVLPGEDDSRRRRLQAFHLPIFIGLVTAAATRWWIFTRIEHTDVRLDWRLGLVSLDMLGEYMKLLVFPTDQTIFHTIDPIARVSDPRALASAAMAVAAVVLIWILHRTRPAISLGFLWYFIVMLPSSVLVSAGWAEPMAEHRVYLASCGFFLAVGVGADAMARRLAPARSARRIFRASAVILLVLLMGKTVVRNAMWSDPVALWLEAVGAAPDHWLPYVPLGEELHRRGDHSEAVAALATAIRLRPEQPETYGKLGVCLVETGQLPAAEAVFRRAGELSPGSGEAAYGLGLVAMARQEPAAAVKYFELAHERDPGNAAVRQAMDAARQQLEGLQFPDR